MLVEFPYSATRSAPAAARLVNSMNMADPIPAWSRMCTRYPGECSVDLSEPAIVPLTPAIWKLLVSVNRRVNHTIRPRADREHWGVEDHWDFPYDGFGDCEDYQLLKRRLLVRAGLPARALRMTVVIDEHASGHAVMLVRTDQGDYVLDNRRSEVLPWYKTTYIYVKREGDYGAGWVSTREMVSPIGVASHL
ncbi:transglutaminase-like cysteine peptidase [Microvirga arabica]|nr:transglutaminase-like cysteine peptidase [Microvirga arabica]